MDTAKSEAAKAGATIAEAMFVTTLEDERLARPAEREKIGGQIDKLTFWAQSLSTEIRPLVHAKVLQEALFSRSSSQSC